MINAMMISNKDNVAVAIEHIQRGSTIHYKDASGSTGNLIACDDIKIYHKFALMDIQKDNFIIKYSEHIGKASRDIKQGEHVHDHNVLDCREDLENLI